MRAEAKTNGNSTSGETGASARPARKVVRCQGVCGALVKGADGWKLDLEHEVQALAAKDGTGCVLDRFKALAAALNAGVVAVSDVGRLKQSLGRYSRQARRSGPLRAGAERTIARCGLRVCVPVELERLGVVGLGACQPTRRQRLQGLAGGVGSDPGRREPVDNRGWLPSVHCR